MRKHQELLKTSGLWCTAVLAGLFLLTGSAQADSNQNQLTINPSPNQANNSLTTNETAGSTTNELAINQGSQSFNVADNGGQKTSDDGYQDMIIPHYDQNHRSPYEDLLNPSSRPVTTDTSHGNRMDVISVPQNTRENEVKNVNVGYLDQAQAMKWSNGKTDLTVSGWHLAGSSNEQPYRWLILYDLTEGKEVSRQEVDGAIVRTDVAKAYPKFTNAAYAGFNARFNLPNTVQGHQLALVARFSDDPSTGEGHRTDYWMRLNYGNYAWLDSVENQGDGLQVSGWHAAGKAYGRRFHYLIVIDANNNQEYGRQLVTDPISRLDVEKVYPTLLGADLSGFQTKIHLSGNYAGRPLRIVSRYTDDPIGNQSDNCVDYYFAPLNNRENRGYLDSWTVKDGKFQAQGWHAADTSLTLPYHYMIVFDHTSGQQVACLQVPLQTSADVAKTMPDICQSGRSRFNVDFGQLPLVAGHHYSLVSRYSSTNQGNGDGQGVVKTDYWFDLGRLDAQKYGYVDQHVINGQQLSVAGWAASGQAIDKPYLQIIAVDSDGELGRVLTPNIARPDVAKIYPHLYRSAMSGYRANIHLIRPIRGQLKLVVRYTNLLNGYDPRRCVDLWYNL